MEQQGQKPPLRPLLEVHGSAADALSADNSNNVTDIDGGEFQ
jgi:hypothetical protein